MPPDVGYAETSSLIVKPMMRMNIAMTGQPHEIAIGPPLLQACPKVVKQPARMEMIENEMAKLEKPDQLRDSSCLYPSLARCSSSGLRATCSWIGSVASGMVHLSDRRRLSRTLDPLSTGCKQVCAKLV